MSQILNVVLITKRAKFSLEKIVFILTDYLSVCDLKTQKRLKNYDMYFNFTYFYRLKRLEVNYQHISTVRQPVVN